MDARDVPRARARDRDFAPPPQLAGQDLPQLEGGARGGAPLAARGAPRAARRAAAPVGSPRPRRGAGGRLRAPPQRPPAPSARSRKTPASRSRSGGLAPPGRGRLGEQRAAESQVQLHSPLQLG